MPLPESFAKDGIGTNVRFANCPEELYFVEVKIKLPGWSHRGGIPITNLRNQVTTTQLPKTLAEPTNMSLVVQASTKRAYAWDIASLKAMCGPDPTGAPQLIYWRSPPNLQGLRALYRGYGWADTLESHEVADGEEPLWDMTVLLANTTPGGVESPPLFLQFV